MTAPIDILLVEDNEGDVHLTQEALKKAKVRNRVHTTTDGVEAMQFLRREKPFADAPRQMWHSIDTSPDGSVKGK